MTCLPPDDGTGPGAGPHDGAQDTRAPAGPSPVAEDIQRHRPGWLVLYGVYSRQFVAFPLFAVRRRVIVTAKYPDALTARMDAAEQRLRIWPRQSEGNES